MALFISMKFGFMLIYCEKKYCLFVEKYYWSSVVEQGEYMYAIKVVILNLLKLACCHKLYIDKNN